MKKLLLSFSFVLLLLSLQAQSPEGINYQAIARTAGGDVIANQLVSFRISILEGSTSGTSVYSERHSLSTNAFGLANLVIGSGVIDSGVFADIDWGTNSHFVKIELDETGGTTYSLVGTSQLMSVPYALHAKMAENVVEKTYSIGLWPELGGYVFWVSADGKHGLVAETVNQGSSDWYGAQYLISDPGNHSVDGAKFRDWRLPTIIELGEMYTQRAAIGGFFWYDYWSSTESDSSKAWYYLFGSGAANFDNKVIPSVTVRAVRDF